MSTPVDMAPCVTCGDYCVTRYMFYYAGRLYCEGDKPEGSVLVKSLEYCITYGGSLCFTMPVYTGAKSPEN